MDGLIQTQAVVQGDAGVIGLVGLLIFVIFANVLNIRGCSAQNRPVGGTRPTRRPGERPPDRFGSCGITEPVQRDQVH